MENIAALFDLDGVIVDSESQYTIFWSSVDELYPTGLDNFSLRIKGSTLTEIFARYFPDQSVRNDITERLNNFEANMDYPIKPGVMHTLSFLRGHDIPAVLVTSSNDQKMSALWKCHPDLKGMFTDIVTAERVSRSKPDPEGYLLGARLAGCRPCRCAVFEDSEQGVRAGHASGAFTIGIEGTVTAQRLAQYADMVIPGFDSLDLDALCNTLKSR